MHSIESKVSIKDLLSSIEEPSQVLGEKGRIVLYVDPIHIARYESVTFCSEKGEKGLQMIRNSHAGVIICYSDLHFTETDYNTRTLILVTKPRTAFIQIMKKYFTEEKVECGISHTAVVEKGAEIHPNVYIGPHCYIGRCKVDKDTIIHGNNYIYSNTKIGKNVIIQAGAVIGAEGVGAKRNAEGEVEKFPQIGGVIIEDNVRIGSNTSVMRGTMGNTLIHCGTTIGHLCNIGHDAIIGSHCFLSSHVVLGGAIQIGDYTQISIGACIRPKIEIGRNVLVGMGAVVTKNVPDGKIVFGVPAKESNMSSP
jgi:UDP-3-O-[3-hydroxymyristoyl] glucosamine N-acyltransferase